MKILFVYPGIATIGFNSYNSGDFSATAVPLGIGYLASAVEQAGFESDVMDLRYLTNFSQVEEIIASSDANVIGLSIQTPSFEYGAEVAAIAKKHNKVVIAGGIHATVMPDDFRRKGCFDHLITGEGEITLVELLRSIKNNETSPQTIKGKPITDMDCLPFAKDFPLYKNVYQQVHNIETGRGCPAKCTYCVSGKNQVFGRSVKQRSLEHILSGIAFYKEKYNFYNIALEDVNATNNKSYFISFCEKLSSIYPDLRVTISSRVDCFDEDIAKALKLFSEAIVWFGFESVSPRLMKFLRKGVNIKQNYMAVDLCKKYKIDIGANVLVGVPTQTDDEIRATYDFIKDICPTLIYYNVLSPFPGTEIAEYCKKNNLLGDNESYERYEITQILKKGILKGIDYDMVREWHPKFLSCSSGCDPMNLGRIFEQNNNLEQAENEYRKSLEQGKKIVQTLYHLGSVLKKMKREDEALIYFNKMDDFNPDTNELFFARRHFHIGEIYLIKGDLERGKIEFLKCVNIMPDHKKAQSHLKWLSERTLL